MMKEKLESYTLSSVVDFNSRTSLANKDQMKREQYGSSDKITEKLYDPHEHRNIEHPNTYFGAIIHIIKGSLGTGVLATPRAFKTAGLAVGAVGTVLIGILCTYNIRLLVSASHKICVRTKTPSLGFPETIEEVFKNGPKWIRNWSTFSRVFVEIALCLTYYLAIAVYAVFIAESLAKLVSFYYPPADTWEIYFKLMLLVLLVFCCQIRELKHMVPFSFIANATLVVAFAITLYYMVVEIQKVDISERNLATSITSIPSYFSTVLFAMEGIGSIMPVENTMAESKFLGNTGVLNAAMAFVVACHTSIGFCGYFAFGEKTDAAITQNLPSDEVPAQVVQACISTSMFFTFVLNHYVPTDILWRRIKSYIPPKKYNVAQIMLRSGTVTFAIAVAAAAGHNLDALIDIVGAVFFSILGLFVPAVVDILINWDDWGAGSWKLYKNFMLILLAFFALISGSYYAVLGFMK